MFTGNEPCFDHLPSCTLSPPLFLTYVTLRVIINSNSIHVHCYSTDNYNLLLLLFFGGTSQENICLLGYVKLSTHLVCVCQTIYCVVFNLLTLVCCVYIVFIYLSLFCMYQIFLRTTSLY